MKFTITKRTNLARLLTAMGLQNDPDTMQLLVELVTDTEYYGCEMSTPIWGTHFTVVCEPLSTQQLAFC